jgi:hypothetical protein
MKVFAFQTERSLMVQMMQHVNTHNRLRSYHEIAAGRDALTSLARSNSVEKWRMLNFKRADVLGANANALSVMRAGLIIIHGAISVHILSQLLVAITFLRSDCRPGK